MKKTTALAFTRRGGYTISRSLQSFVNYLRGKMVTPGQKWYNELDSEMEITSVDTATGVFDGRYCSRVGEAEYWYVLTGRQDTDGNTIGWTVNWQISTLNAHSVSTWSGQLQYTPSGDPTILTTWLFTSQTDPKDNWESTQVGFDVFSLTEPCTETKEKAKLHGRRSHPKAA